MSSEEVVYPVRPRIAARRVRRPEAVAWKGTRRRATAIGAGLVLAMLAAARIGGTGTDELVVIAPLDGAVFPRDIVAPRFRWSSTSTDGDWEVHLFTAGGTLSARVKARTEWRPDEVEWSRVKEASLTQPARFTVRRVVPEAPQGPRSEASISFRTSADAVVAPLFYREVPLPVSYAMDNKQSIRWRLGLVSSPEPPTTVLSGMRTCANCHSFSADGKTLAMDLDFGSDKGAYAVATVEPTTRIGRDQMMTWSDFRREDGEGTFGLLSTISPDGRFVVSTVKETIFLSFSSDLYSSQLFFPTRGILASWNRTSGEFRPVEGADSKAFVQTNPSFSPDGKSVAFARAPAPDIPRRGLIIDAKVIAALAPEFTEGRRVLRFDLYRIPFESGRGGKATPISGAAANDRSNYFPRFSPDGKWLVFCQASSMMLNRPDSTLMIMRAEGGTARRMNCNARDRMNSWHSFSPNGRWLAFASKAAGPWTQIWLTHVDDEGWDTVPVMLDGFVSPGMAGNIPEFVNATTSQMRRIEIAAEIREAPPTLPRRSR